MCREHLQSSDVRVTDVRTGLVKEEQQHFFFFFFPTPWITGCITSFSKPESASSAPGVSPSRIGFAVLLAAFNLPSCAFTARVATVRIARLLEWGPSYDHTFSNIKQSATGLVKS